MCPVSRGTSRSKLALETGTAKLWLLLVGVSQYQDEQLPPLHYPALDCQGLAEALAEATQGFPQKEVLIHHDLAARRPELNTIRASLQHIAAAAQPQDTIVFYFSGHGMLQGRPDGFPVQQAMLCLTDTQKNNLLNTGLGLQEVLHTLGKSAAGQQLVWLDACHSGGMTLLGAKGGADDSLNPTSQLVEVLRQRAAQSKGFYALLSCDQAQQSWEFPELGHGVFTYYLMQGLRGEAADAQGVIEADGLYRYVYHQTLRYIDKTNQQLRLMNQQKRSRGETQLYPEYPLQTPKRIVEGVGELILGLKPTGRSLCSATQGVTVTANQGVDEVLRTAEGSGGSGVRSGKMATLDVGETMSELKSSATAIEAPTESPIVSRTVRPKRHPSLRTLLLVSVVITTLVMGVRYLGLLQTKELQAFDGLMRLRPDEKPDSRLLVVTLTEEDIQAQNQEARKGSLSDRSLAQLLQKLNQYQPIAIGLDLYRDFPTDSNQRNLAKLLQDERLIGVCKVSDPESHDPGVRPPLEIPPERLGFSDFSTDPDGVLRRQLLALNPGPASPCTTPYALSTQLAFRYLDAKGISPKFTLDKNLQLGKVVFKHLEAHTGGYQQLDARGHQVLLNYRSFQDIAPHVTLKQVLTGQLAPSYVKDRVVLIGVTAPSAGDYWSTPDSVQATEPQMSGVFVQAQMLSQILSAVLDGRLLLWVWPVWGEALWVWGWSLVGGAIAWRCRSLLHLGLAVGVAQGTLYGFCFCLLITQGCWVPLVPAAIALIATGGVVVIYTQTGSRQRRIHPSL